jgi:alanine-synthesizing transaminase
MEFRRITGLPPYVFTIIDGLKIEARRQGLDVIDLGFGNPDLPSPQIAVEKLAEAAVNTRNHRYSASRGIPKLREAVADLYLRRFGVALDPDREVIATIGAKEGFSHLMWVLLQPGDAALVPSPSYPIHIWGPLFAGADVREIPMGTGTDFFEKIQEAWEYSWPKPRVIVLSFPTTQPPRVWTSTSSSGWWTSPETKTWWWSTTTRMPSSGSTATSRPASSRPRAPRSARWSCTR